MPNFRIPKNFLVNDELKKIFDTYKIGLDFESQKQKFLYFLVDEIIDDFYENYNFDIEEVDENNVIAKEDFIYLEFFDEDKKTFLAIVGYPKLENYQIRNLENDLVKIKNFEYFTSRKSKNPEDFNSIIYIVSSNISDDVKSYLNRKAPELRKIGININLLNEENILNRFHYKNQEKPKYSNYNFELKSKSKHFEIVTSDYKIIMANVLGSSIANAWKNTKGTILKKNLRGYIKNRKIDDDINDTMKKEPQNFSLYNNGITAVASKKNGEIIDGDVLKFDEFYIINGGQTAKLMTDFYSSPLNQRNRDLSVLLKIIIPSSGSLSKRIIDKVSLTSNQQKAIKIQDLWATDKQLMRWANNFKMAISDYNFSIKRDSTEKRVRKSLDLPFFIQLAVSTIKADPYDAKNHKSKILGNDSLVRGILRTINLDVKDIQCFVYDILMINETIDKCLKKLKKPYSPSLIDDSNSKITILRSGRLFIISLLYFFHLIKKINNIEKRKLMEDLRHSVTQDKSAIFKEIVDKSPVVGILNRGEYAKNQEVNYFDQVTESNLEYLVSKIVDDLLDNTRWSPATSELELDWMKIFKQGERGWKFALPFVEKLIKYELTKDNPSLRDFPSDNLIYLINKCIV